MHPVNITFNLYIIIIGVAEISREIRSCSRFILYSVPRTIKLFLQVDTTGYNIY